VRERDVDRRECGCNMICLPICPFVFLSVCLSVCLSVHLPVYVCVTRRREMTIDRGKLSCSFFFSP
jgi:hypothetical protein